MRTVVVGLVDVDVGDRVESGDLPLRERLDVPSDEEAETHPFDEKGHAHVVLVVSRLSVLLTRDDSTRRDAGHRDGPQHERLSTLQVSCAVADGRVVFHVTSARTLAGG